MSVQVFVKHGVTRQYNENCEQVNDRQQQSRHVFCQTGHCNSNYEVSNGYQRHSRHMLANFEEPNNCDIVFGRVAILAYINSMHVSTGICALINSIFLLF